MNFSKIVFTYMLDILPTLPYFMPFSGTYFCIMHFMIFIWIVSSLIQHYLQKRLTLGINHGSNVAVAHFQDSQYWCDHTQQQQHQRVHRSHPRPQQGTSNTPTRATQQHSQTPQNMLGSTRLPVDDNGGVMVGSGLDCGSQAGPQEDCYQR